MNSKIVVDTSVIVKWLNQTNEADVEKADKILEAALNNEVEILAPELARYEVGNVLLKGKQLTTNEAYISLGTAYSLPVNFVTESEELAKKTYSFAFELGITYYDASFISLAKQYNATLVTENLKYQGRTRQVNIKALKDY